jgi:hypothetical protein
MKRMYVRTKKYRVNTKTEKGRRASFKLEAPWPWPSNSTKMSAKARTAGSGK